MNSTVDCKHGANAVENSATRPLKIAKVAEKFSLAKTGTELLKMATINL